MLLSRQCDAATNSYDAYQIFRLINDMIEPTLKKQIFLDIDIYFPDHVILEANFHRIQTETMEMLQRYIVHDFSDFDDGNKNIAQSNSGGKWRTMPLKLLGRSINTDVMPATAALISSCRRVRNAFISVLDPHTSLERHTGNFQSVVKYHLCLHNVQPDLVWLEVNGTRRYWKEGESFIFDDMLPHSVANHGSYPRVVLFLDIVRVLPLKLQALDFIVMLAASWTHRFQQYVEGSRPDPNTEHIPASEQS